MSSFDYIYRDHAALGDYANSLPFDRVAPGVYTPDVWADYDAETRDRVLAEWARTGFSLPEVRVHLDGPVLVEEADYYRILDANPLADFGGRSVGAWVRRENEAKTDTFYKRLRQELQEVHRVREIVARGVSRLRKNDRLVIEEAEDVLTDASRELEKGVSIDS